MQTPQEKLNAFFSWARGSKTSSYRQEKIEGDRVRFMVKAADVPRSTFGPRGMGLCAAALTFYLLNGKMGRNAVIAAAAAYIATRYVFDKLWALNVNYSRVRGGSFVVSPAGLEVDGKTVPAAQVRLLLRNSAPNAAPVSNVVYDAGSATQQLGAAAAQARIVNQGIAASVSYNLCLEHEGRSTALAGGMTEVTARGLLADTARILGLKTW